MDLTQTQGIMVMTLVGFLLIGIGALLLIKGKSKTSRLTMPVTARVVDILKEEMTEEYEDGHGRERSRTRAVYTPVLEYEAGGRTYRESRIYGSAPNVSVGSSIRVFCNPATPSEARYASNSGHMLAAAIAIVAGGWIVLQAMLQLAE